MAEKVVELGRRKARTLSAQKEKEDPQALAMEEVTVEIADLRTFSESKNFWVYGPSGHGKTTLTGFAPNACFVAAEKGVEAARYAGSKASVIRAPTWEHLCAAQKLCIERFGPEDWVILDSMPKAQTLNIRWILQEIHKIRPTRDLDIPAIADHQKWQNGFKRWIDKWVDADFNCIFTATEMFRDDEDSEVTVLPAILGRGSEVCNYIRAQMDVVAYYGITDKTKSGYPIRRALFQPWDRYVAPKDRYRTLGQYRDVPDEDTSAIREWIEEVFDAAERAKKEKARAAATRRQRVA